MLAGLLILVRSNSADAGAPEPLDTEFLDYLLACESKDDNWTVVADEKLAQESQQGSGAQGKISACRQGEAAGGEAMIRKILFAVVAVLLLTGEAAAQQQAAAPALEWSELSNEQRALLGNLESQWPTLPAERRQQLIEGATRWLSLSDEQRAEVRQRFALWQSLPPERRAEIRQRYEQFRALSPEEQARIRSTQQRVRELPPERRDELQKRWREMTPEQRQHGRPENPRANRGTED